MEKRSVSTQTLQRLPLYLNYLRSLPDDTPENISATAVRRLLAEGRLADIQPLVPETTYAYCQRHFGGRPPRP